VTIHTLILCSLACIASAAPAKWRQSFDAGYFDAQGQWVGGSEIMHLAAHGEKLFAANGYWLDARWVIPPEGQKQSAQVLRLDKADGRWQVDLDLGRANHLGLEFMKGNILKSVSFSTTGEGRVLNAPVQLLVMAAGANFERGGAVSAWVRDDAAGKWHHTLVRHGSNAGGVRWVPRDLQVYRDRVTGIDRIFLLLGNPGIISGVYDSREPSLIRWDRHVEFPFLEKGSFFTRPLGIAEANNALHFSEGPSIFRRIDGKRPRWEEILNLAEDTDTDVGGIRGLTTIPNPNGKGQSLLFVWAPGERSQSQVKRLDPDGKGGYTLHNEVNLGQIMSRHLGVKVPYTLGGHNMMYPVPHPATGAPVQIIGFYGSMAGKPELMWKGSRFYGGALFALRTAAGKYTVHEVNGPYAPGKTLLVSPRAFCQSPFDPREIFIGGHDSSNKISDNLAWIFRAPLSVALGVEKGEPAPTLPDRSPRMPRVDDGPVYELRIYAAAEDRLGHLVKRFREHTDRLFQKHKMESIGYWIPTDGTAKEKRRFVYILKHPSRYAAYKNWNAFTHDPEWKRGVLEQPEFQRLLAERPTSIFMTANDYSAKAPTLSTKVGGIYELRTYTAAEKKLNALNARFANHTTRIFTKHGMNNVGYWTPYDRPELKNTLIYLIHHESREKADKNWQAFGQDPDWKKVARDSQREGKLLIKKPERLYLKPLDFSPLR
jgi:hypothetical protein